jgi:hypothetical protein
VTLEGVPVRKLNTYFSHMKRPGIFKTPKHQRFNLTPRHYDPVKEELEARIARIKSEVEREKQGVESEEDDLPYGGGSLRGAFKQRSNRTKSKVVNGSQLVIMVLIMSAIGAYWYYGNNGLYVVLLASSLLLYLRLRRYI